MKMDRRDFLKGMLAISVAAVALPLLPSMEVEAAAETVEIFKTGAVGMSEMMGRLGRVRIDRTWFPLEDAEFTMFRRHVPKLIRHNYSTSGDTFGPRNTEYPPTNFAPTTSEPRSLVDSPWQMQIWTPDMGVHDVYNHMEELEFEFNIEHRGFKGAGYATEMERSFMDNREVDEGPVLFSITLGGSEKFQRIS